jgi:hypothetical protein
MKKILISFFLFFSLIGFAKAEDLASNAVSAVIMEYSTGKIFMKKIRSKN